MRYLTLFILLPLTIPLSSANDGAENNLRDPFFGEALYYAKQGEFFNAIARLDTELRLYYGIDEPELDTLHFYVNEATFSVGDFELSYRMHRKAGRAIKAVIEGNVAPQVRNEAIYRLAKIYFQKEQNLNALHAIDRIEGRIPEAIADDITFLKGQIYMVNGRFQEAEDLFKSINGKIRQKGYAEYNLGLVRLAQGNLSGAISALEDAGTLRSDDRAVLAIKDKANLMLGSRLMDEGEYPTATKFFERVRIDGPFSNRALLGLGWASATSENYPNALVPWTLLSQRHVTDPSVQDAMLSVPYAYEKLGLYGKAALGYGHALSVMNKELDRLDASIKSIDEGTFLELLVREEFKQDRNWVVKLRELPQTPETYYLIDLMASHDFQSSLQNYFDLEQLRKNLEKWSDYYASYDEIIALRRRYYEPLLPGIDEQFRKLDSLINLRLEQRDRINNKLQSMLIAPQPELLATADERSALLAIQSFEDSPSNNSEQTQYRVDRLKGHITWNWTIQYNERLTKTFEHLAALDNDIARLKTIYESFVRTRQAATQSYQGYDKNINNLRIKTKRAIETVETLMLRQGRMLEVMAIGELRKRSQKLESSQVQARFAMAESYDRATMSKLEKVQEEKPIKETIDKQASAETEGQGEL
ncbi:MAG: tetratricopeptide repeat protein [Exilibacterium sp.]